MDSADRVDLIAALRAAGSVLAADRLLASAGPIDWAAVDGAHRSEPFGRPVLRAFAGRPDFPRGALPFEPALTRGVPGVPARADWYPAPTVLAALHRIGEVRPRYFREAAGTGAVRVADLLTATRRLDLLARALGDCGHDPYVSVHREFWATVGFLLRPALGTDPAAWLGSATRLPRHAGGLRSLKPGPATSTVELHLIAQAPDEVVAAVLDGWTDDEIAVVRPTRCQLQGALVRRALRAGGRPRRAYAGWVRSGADEETWRAVLPVAGDHVLAADIRLRAERSVDLRRRLAPAVPAARDLTAALRTCATVLDAEGVLRGTLPDDLAPPWSELTAAHADAPLPVPVLRVLADRAGFPDELAAGLHDYQLVDLADRSPAAARTAFRRLRWRRLTVVGGEPVAVTAVANGVLTVGDVLALARPAAAVLGWAYDDRGRPAPSADRYPVPAARAARVALVRTALRAEIDRRGGAPVIPDGFDGPLAALLA